MQLKPFSFINHFCSISTIWTSCWLLTSYEYFVIFHLEDYFIAIGTEAKIFIK